VAAFLPHSSVNGPGLRSVLWVQGCPLRCPGCFNPRFLPFEGGAEHNLEEVAGWIISAPETDGVTLSGGEPFAQAAGLAAVAHKVRSAGKSVVIFSGYDWPTLSASTDPAWRDLLAAADAVIAGPYRRDLPAGHHLLGSANQEIFVLSARYAQADFASPARRRVEYHIGADGTTTVTGFPTQEQPGAARDSAPRKDAR
jgi:anaerobic ribonucleoside-triphosphate reductase activating protein